MARSPFVDIHAIKTRLASVLPRVDDRRAVYLAFLLDTIAKCRSLPAVELRVAYVPVLGSGDLGTLNVAPDERLAQRGDDLGARERGIFEDLFVQGFEAVVVIGSDLPTLPTAHLQAAFTALGEGAELVLGPADDGGYYLIGLRRPADGAVPDLFTGIRWSTRHALEDTLRAASGLRLVPSFVPAWHDVDDEVGWRRLMTDLSEPDLAGEAPATREEVVRLVRNDHRIATE